MAADPAYTVMLVNRRCNEPPARSNGASLYVVIRAQLERHIDEAELLELADDLDSRFTLEGKALTAELEEASLTYIEA